MADDGRREVVGVVEVVTSDATTTSLRQTEMLPKLARLNGCGSNTAKKPHLGYPIPINQLDPRDIHRSNRDRMGCRNWRVVGAGGAIGGGRQSSTLFPRN